MATTAATTAEVVDTTPTVEELSPEQLQLMLDTNLDTVITELFAVLDQCRAVNDTIVERKHALIRQLNELQPLLLGAWGCGQETAEGIINPDPPVGDARRKQEEEAKRKREEDAKRDDKRSTLYDQMRDKK